MSLSTTHPLAYPRVTTVGDFLALLKPRVMSLVVFTGLAGIVTAPGSVHPLTAFTALLCIAVAAGASGCLNMAYDSDMAYLIRGSSLNWWKGGGDGSVHSSVVAPTPQGLSAALRFFVKASRHMTRNTITPKPAMKAPIEAI